MSRLHDRKKKIKNPLGNMAGKIRIDKKTLIIDGNTAIINEPLIVDDDQVSEQELQALNHNLKTVNRPMTSGEMHNLKELLKTFDGLMRSYPSNTLELTDGIVTFNLIRHEGPKTNEKFRWQVRFSINSDHTEITLGKVRVFNQLD